jgi:hypothetical protein
MPKSNIYDPTPRGVNMETGEEGPERLRRVSVGWSRGLHVQIGVGWVDQNNVTIAPNAPGITTSSSYAPAFDETDERGRRWQAQWCDMDRHSLNQLIRELRKARDEAFGRDE